MSTTDTSIEVAGFSTIPSQLRQIAEQVAKGQRPAVTVRTLISWFFGSQRRGRWIVSVIRRALDKLDLRTEPDFDSTYLDATVAFVPKIEIHFATAPTIAPSDKSGSFSADAVLEVAKTPVNISEQIDPTHRISRLGIANKTPVSVSPDTAIAEAITIMLMNDFSQLPVMTSDREVKGLISWKSLGTLWSQGRDCSRVGDAMDRHSEIEAEASLFDAIALLRRDDCVLVRDRQKRISGIITSYDVSVTFSELSEPFLILDEIENHIRQLIEGKFTKEELSGTLAMLNESWRT